MKILFNSPNPKLHGGPPTHLPFLEAKLRERLDLTPFEYGRKSDHETLSNKIIGRFLDLINTKKTIQKVKPDIIHHNSSFDSRGLLRDAPLVLLSNTQRVPIFIKMHGAIPETFTDSKFLTRICRRIVLKKSAGIGVLSQAEKKEFEQHFPWIKGKVFVVKNIIKPDFFSVKRQESDIPIVLFISRFIRKKGAFDLLNAVPEILLKIPETQFLFVGDGASATEFDQEVIERKLSINVRRFAHVDNIQTKDFYSRAWVFVFPTHFPEGMPMVVAEAMATGVPLVTSKTLFSLSYMNEGQHCLYINNRTNEIADQIIRVLSDRDIRLKMSVENKKLAHNFSAETVANEYVEVYTTVCKQPRK